MYISQVQAHILTPKQAESLALSLCSIFPGLLSQFISVTYLRQTGGKLFHYFTWDHVTQNASAVTRQLEPHYANGAPSALVYSVNSGICTLYTVNYFFIQVSYHIQLVLEYYNPSHYFAWSTDPHFKHLFSDRNHAHLAHSS